MSEPEKHWSEPPDFAWDFNHWRGYPYAGKHGHWCNDWDGLPIDETCPEWPCICAPELEKP